MNSRVDVLTPFSQPRGRSLAIGVTFVILAVLAGFVAFIPHMAFVAVSAIYLGAFVAYLGFRRDAQGGYLFEVIVPFSVLSFLYFGVGTTYLAIVPKALDYPGLAPFLLPAQALTLLAYLCFLVGYGWFFQRTKSSPLGRFVPRGHMIYLAPAAVGAAGMSLEKFQREGILSNQGISPAISFVQQFGPLFFFSWFLAWYMLFARRLRLAAALMILGALSLMALLVLYFTIGGKGLPVIMVGVPLIAYYEIKRRIPWKSVLVLLLIFIFLIFPMYNTFRRLDRGLDVSRRVDRAVGVVSTLNSAEYLDASLFAFLKRITVITSVAAVVSDTGRWVEYRHGETLILAPIALFIPRFVWPEKPNISIGREFADVFRLTNPTDRETYIAPSMVGDLYWNFAVPGVVIGMWLLGMGYRWYYQRYGAGAGFDPVRKSIYVTLLPTVLIFEGNVAFVVASAFKMIIILNVFLIVAHRMGWLDERVAT